MKGIEHIPVLCSHSVETVVVVHFQGVPPQGSILTLAGLACLSCIEAPALQYQVCVRRQRDSSADLVLEGRAFEYLHVVSCSSKSNGCPQSTDARTHYAAAECFRFRHWPKGGVAVKV